MFFIVDTVCLRTEMFGALINQYISVISIIKLVYPIYFLAISLKFGVSEFKYGIYIYFFSWFDCIIFLAFLFLF